MPLSPYSCYDIGVVRINKRTNIKSENRDIIMQEKFCESCGAPIGETDEW